MHKFILIVSICFFGNGFLSAQCCDNDRLCNPWPAFQNCGSSAWPSPITLDAGIGFRKDKFHWAIPIDSSSSSTLSKIQWKDLRMVEYWGRAEYVSCTNYAIRLEGDYSHIYHGEYQDTDYQYKKNSSKKEIYSYSVANAGRGHTYDCSAAVGYRLTSDFNRFIATPLVGYSEHGQVLHMYDGNQLISLVPDVLFVDVNGPYQVTSIPIGAIDGLMSHYKTRWFGPWVGIDFTAQVERCAYLFGSLQWHMLEYRGHGDWNLRTDIGPFDHKAYGYGYLIMLGTKWEIWNDWSIGLMGSYRMFRTKGGHEILEIIPQVQAPFKVKTPFSGAVWHSFSASGIISYRF